MEMECKESSNTDNSANTTDAIDTPSTSSPAPRLGMCEVCAVAAAKYTCPRCEVKTCCLRCAKIHKGELECNGACDKTKFVPVNKFTNLDLSSDYRMLEEITRSVETLKKNRNGRLPQNGDLPHHLFKLLKAASARKTTLKFLPRHFTRHRQNTSRLNFKSQVVFWHIDWVFANTDLKLSDDNVPETAKLCNVLHKYLVKQDDAVVQEKLQFYQAVGLPGIKLFLKAEQKGGCKFYELDPLASLKDNLKNKTIIEYPTIYVVLKEHADLYDVLDSDDEGEEMDVDMKKSGAHVVNQIIKKAEQEESIYSSLRNLLFISDNSDGGDE